VILNPLPPDHTPLEAQLRKDLTIALTQAPGMKVNDINRSLNASTAMVHEIAQLVASTLDVSKPQCIWRTEDV
jgi:hypothetical protein